MAQPPAAQFLDAREVAGLCAAAGFGPPAPPCPECPACPTAPPCPPCPPCPPPSDPVALAHYPPAERFYRQFAAGILAVAVLGYLAAYLQWGLTAWCCRPRAPDHAHEKPA